MKTGKVSAFSGILFSALLLAPPLARADVVGDGTVVDVNWPGKEAATCFDVANGDTVGGGHGLYTPKQDAHWAKAGEKYNLIVVTKPASSAQLFIVFWGTGHEHPNLDTSLGQIDTVVRGVGVGNQPIQEGDTVKISTQAAEGGGVDVTLDVYRGRAAVATFSFVQGVNGTKD